MSKHFAHLPQCASSACTKAVVPALATCCVSCASATSSGIAMPVWVSAHAHLFLLFLYANVPIKWCSVDYAWTESTTSTLSVWHVLTFSIWYTTQGIIFCKRYSLQKWAQSLSQMQQWLVSWDLQHIASSTEVLWTHLTETCVHKRSSLDDHMMLHIPARQSLLRLMI